MEIVKGTRVAVFGATADIGASFVAACAQKGATLYLVGRNQHALERIAVDAQVRGGAVSLETFDFSDISGIRPLVQRAFETLGGIDVAAIFYGVLSENAACERDLLELERQLRVNFISPAAVLTELGTVMKAHEQKGVLVAVTSVAGDRGRASNFVYGSGKAGLSAFCSGLGQALAPHGVVVVDVRPGFVATKMTNHLSQGPLFVSPDAVARGIVRAIHRESPVVYLPWFWRFIMGIIVHLPARLFRKLSF